MLLNLDDILRMVTAEPVTCPECARETRQNYCRQCDEFFRVGHAPSCAQHGEHAGHRIYPNFPTLPFLSDLSEWAVYLDVTRQNHVWIEQAAVRAMFGESSGTRDFYDTFMDMGYRALSWAENGTHSLRDGLVYPMHFDGSQVVLRIGVLGGQLVVFTPRLEFEGS